MQSWNGEQVVHLSEHKRSVLDALLAAGEAVSPTWNGAPLYVEDDGKGKAFVYVMPAKGGTSLASAKVALEAAGFVAKLTARGSRDRLVVRRVTH